MPGFVLPAVAGLGTERGRRGVHLRPLAAADLGTDQMDVIERALDQLPAEQDRRIAIDVRADTARATHQLGVLPHGPRVR